MTYFQKKISYEILYSTYYIYYISYGFWASYLFFHNNETTKIIKLSTVGYNVDERYNLKN